MRELASSISCLVMMKNIFLQFAGLYNMTCAGVYRKVEDELSIYIQNKIPSYVPKNKLKLSICIWYLRIDIEHLNLLFLLKLHPATVERQLSYLKCFVTMPLWQSDNLGIILCHQSFLLHCLSLPCQKLLPLLESIFFPYDFKNTTHSITLINSHAVSRNTQIIFIALTFSWRRPISYRNPSIDVHRKSMDWFLYDIGLRHERVNGITVSYLKSVTVAICQMS